MHSFLLLFMLRYVAVAWFINCHRTFVAKTRKRHTNEWEEMATEKYFTMDSQSHSIPLFRWGYLFACTKPSMSYKIHLFVTRIGFLKLLPLCRYRLQLNTIYLKCTQYYEWNAKFTWTQVNKYIFASLETKIAGRKNNSVSLNNILFKCNVFVLFILSKTAPFFFLSLPRLCVELWNIFKWFRFQFFFQTCFCMCKGERKKRFSHQFYKRFFPLCAKLIASSTRIYCLFFNLSPSNQRRRWWIRIVKGDNKNAEWETKKKNATTNLLLEPPDLIKWTKKEEWILGKLKCLLSFVETWQTMNEIEFHQVSKLKQRRYSVATLKINPFLRPFATSPFQVGIYQSIWSSFFPFLSIAFQSRNSRELIEFVRQQNTQ